MAFSDKLKNGVEIDVEGYNQEIIFQDLKMII